MVSQAPDRPMPPRAPLIATVGTLLLVALLGLGAWFYRAQKQDLRHQAETQLEAVARLKADQIVAWRQARLDDAAILMERPAFLADARLWLGEGLPKAADETLRRFQSLRKQYRYHDVLLVDPDGTVRLSVSGHAGSYHAGAGAALVAALRERKPVFTELHTETDDPTPHLGVVAPLFSNQGEASRPLGAVILVSDARQFLFPIIQNWPVPSRTAETLLVRRDGDQVLFLNDLRRQPDTVLNPRIPLSRTEVPAVKAALGQEGVFEGKDYRGVQVLAVVKAIPESSWFMVAKIDTAEAFSAWRLQSVLILVLFSGLVGLAGVSLLLLRQRERKAYYRALYQAEAARRRSEQRHGITLNSIGDAVVGTDAEGRVELLNPVAEALTGWTVAEARGRPIEEVFRIINKETREAVASPVERVLREGVVVGLANHTLLIARDGAERPIADSGAPIRDERGGVVGVVLVFRDRTEERAAMEALRESEARFRRLFDIVSVSLCLVDREGVLVAPNDRFLQTFGYTLQDVPTLREWTRLAYPDPDYRRWASQTWQGALRRAMEAKTGIEPMELRVTCKSGEVRTMIVSGSTLGEGFLVTLVDITERKRAEDAISRERDFIRAALDSLPGLFYLFDEQGRFLRWNQNFERVSGYAAEEISRLSPLDLFEGPTKDTVAERIRQVFLTGESCAEGDLVSKDRTKTPHYFTGKLLRFEEKACLVGMGIDITQRKRNEDALLESEDRYRDLVESSQDLICTHDLQGRILSANARSAQLLGYTKDELARMNRRDILMPETRDKFDEYLAEIEKNGRADGFMRVRTKNGEARIWEYHNTLRRAGVAEPLVRGMAHDVTEQKRAEQALRDSEVLFRKLFEHHAAVKLVIDPDSGKIIDANDAAAAFYGWPREQLRQMKIQDINTLSPEEIQGAMEEVQTQKRTQFQFRHRRADGSIRDVEVFSSKIEIHGRDLLHSIIHDISERVRAEAEKGKLQDQLRQAQKMEAVGSLAGGVAHDFNNMLSVILGQTEMALVEAGPGMPLHDRLKEIQKAADRSADLTRQLLAFARKQTIEPRVLDLNTTIEGMLKMLRRLIGEDIDLAWLPGAGLGSVKMDPAQIDQVLANLCVNARDAIIGVGKVTIETENAELDQAYCSAHAGFIPGDYVMLAVSDNGYGMNEETLRQVFDPFFTTKELGKGTGLGLATVYGIVKQNNGFINVYSEPGRGTTFKIYLPRQAAGVVETDVVKSAELPLSHGETVLLVEDEPAILEIGREMLEQLGYGVLSAATPGEALALAREHAGEIDLLVTDVIMPEMNGRDLAEQIRPNRPGMRCLFMSGYTANAIAHHGVLGEGVHFIQKPFTIHGLAAKARTALDE